MNKQRNRNLSEAVLLGIALLAFFAEKFPFYVYDEEELHTSLKQFFSVEHLVRLQPFLIVAALSTVSILACIRIRSIRRSMRRNGLCSRKGTRLKKRPVRLCPGKPVRLQKGKPVRLQKGKPVRLQKGKTVKLQKGKLPVFMKVRWAVMTGFSVLVMFGGIWFGFTLTGIALPVLACPTNRDQMIESSCYFLSHLLVLFEEYSAGGIVLFFVSTIGFAILLGRTICGFLCPMGLVQDIMHGIRQKTRTEGFPMTQTHYRWLKPVKWLLILLMFGLVFAGGEFCSFCPAILLSPVLAGMKVSLYLSGFLMVFVLAGSFFKRRFWCNICPLGYLIGLAHKLSPFRVKKDTLSCTECGACYEACPMGIKMIYTEREKTDVTDINCIMCGECVRNCPEDNALSLAFAGMNFYTASRAGVMSGFQRKPGEEEAEVCMKWKPGEEEAEACMKWKPEEEEAKACMEWEPGEEEAKG